MLVHISDLFRDPENLIYPFLVPIGIAYIVGQTLGEAIADRARSTAWLVAGLVLVWMPVGMALLFIATVIAVPLLLATPLFWLGLWIHMKVVGEG